ncbi:hypothetical protein ACOZ38_30235 [Sphaerisporangium viridialbum]|uniref:hypothetical protein n=1 Tax=Sphaerisporangium viridialbum TaxID=46189 RepID=UPI003C707C91
MRTRSPAALLLLLFSIFLVVGGTPAATLAAPAHHPVAASANPQAGVPAHLTVPARSSGVVSGGATRPAISKIRQVPEDERVLSVGTGPGFRLGAGGQAPHGGLAAVPAASPYHGRPHAATAAVARLEAPAQPSLTVCPARAPPSTAL